MRIWGDRCGAKVVVFIFNKASSERRLQAAVRRAISFRSYDTGAQGLLAVFRKCRRVFVPEGRSRIAQRFNAGTGQFCVAPVPKGRLNPSSTERVPFRPAL